MFHKGGQRSKRAGPSLRLKQTMAMKGTGAIEKSQIQRSFDEPAADAAVMLQLRNSRKGAVGTQELKITGQLVCYEPHGKKSESPYVLV